MRSFFRLLKKDSTTALSQQFPDQAQQFGVLLGAIREGLLEPLVVAARGDVEDAAERLHAYVAR